MSASVAEKLRQKSIEIMVSVDQKQTVDQAEAALLNHGGVYVRARMLVQIVHDVSDSHGIVYPTGQPIIARIGRERLRELLGASATWLSKRKGRGGEAEIAEVQCPPWVAATLEQRGEWSFPALDGISDSPVLRPDGTICDQPGYDAATRTIYDPGSTKYPPIAERPSHADARRAYAELVEPMCDVPYVADSDRAAWASLVLTVLARPAIPGCTPLHLVRAPIRGAGKGLNIDAAAIITTGRESPKRPPITTEDELRKALFAAALESPALVAIDNIEGSLGSPTLAMVITAGIFSDRMLGVSESRSLPVRFVMAATGNNIQLRGDLGRRVVPIDIDPRCENPEDRGGFRYPDLLGHVRAARPRLVAAALTVLRAYVAAGRPAHGKPTYGSFEAWDRLVRGAIVWASGADPLGGIERIREEGDEDADRLRTLVTSWREALGGNPYSVAEVIKRAGDSGDLHDALGAYCKSSEHPDARGVGNALRRLRGRICGNLEIVREPGRAGVAHWAVKPVGGGSGGSGGSLYATRDRDQVSSSEGLGSDPPVQPHPPFDEPLWAAGVADD